MAEQESRIVNIGTGAVLSIGDVASRVGVKVGEQQTVLSVPTQLLEAIGCVYDGAVVKLAITAGDVETRERHLREALQEDYSRFRELEG